MRAGRGSCRCHRRPVTRSDTDTRRSDSCRCHCASPLGIRHSGAIPGIRCSGAIPPPRGIRRLARSRASALWRDPFPIQLKASSRCTTQMSTAGRGRARGRQHSTLSGAHGVGRQARARGRAAGKTKARAAEAAMVSARHVSSGVAGRRPAHRRWSGARRRPLTRSAHLSLFTGHHEAKKGVATSVTSCTLSNLTGDLHPANTKLTHPHVL